MKRNHIHEINKAMATIYCQQPEHPSLQALEAYKQQHRLDYYMALNYIGFRLGIKSAVYQNEPAQAWEGCVQLNEQNSLDQQERESGNKLFPTTNDGYADCCLHAAKQQVKQLLKVANLKDKLKAKKAL